MEETLSLESANETILNAIKKEGKNKSVLLMGECFGACIAINFVTTNPGCCM